MGLLEDYLRVLPGVEKDRIESLLKSEKELFEVKELTEEQFEALVEYLAIEQKPVTKEIELSETIKAEEMNLFFADVAIDLLHLFEEQNLLEGAARNYDRIFSGVLDDIKREIRVLERREQELWLENKGEDGLIVRSYGFDVAEKSIHAEMREQGNEYLFTDRDGQELPDISFERSYHRHYASLSKESDVSRLRNDKGQVTATLRVDYENIGSVDMGSYGYGVEKAIDGSDDTYYMHVVLDTQEAVHRVSKNPEFDGRDGEV